MAFPAGPAPASLPCAICRSSASLHTTRKGAYAERLFHLYTCPSCRFIFIGDPWEDYEQIYSADYYEGRGADPLIDFWSEIHNPRSIRRYEWAGLLEWARALAVVAPSTNWLDFGSGSGGFVSYLRRTGITRGRGYDQSPQAPRTTEAAELTLSTAELDQLAGTFDVVSAIEVIEHLVDPVGELRRIRRLLRPGGLLLATTTNAAPYRGRLATWRYIVPEIHVSFFEPSTLGLALKRAGFEPEFPGYTDGWRAIIRFKLLKNLGRSETSRLERLVPWGPLTRLIDARLQLSGQPVGRAN